jgi:hypothetical protein
MYKYIIILFLWFTFKSNAQELNCIVTINAAEIGVSNRQVFNTMQNAIFEYMNNTKWTNITYQNFEKIDCSITINILENPSTNQYKGTMQLLVSRPVYNSTYKTPILSFNDEDINFNYEEYQPLVYNENSFDSNLLSLLTFYAYTILGFEADTFSYKGGEEFFKSAETVLNMAQQGGGSGWKRIDGNYTRYQLNENILSPVYESFRKAMYDYHINGLDVLVDNKDSAKNAISEAVIGLEEIFDTRPNTFLIRVFMDTKSDEIVDVFSDGPRIDTSELREVLSKISPLFDPKWEKIKI